jgi:hypothetical protein
LREMLEFQIKEKERIRDEENSMRNLYYQRGNNKLITDHEHEMRSKQVQLNKEQDQRYELETIEKQLREEKDR